MFTLKFYLQPRAFWLPEQDPQMQHSPPSKKEISRHSSRTASFKRLQTSTASSDNTISTIIYLESTIKQFYISFKILCRLGRKKIRPPPANFLSQIPAFLLYTSNTALRISRPIASARGEGTPFPHCLYCSFKVP